MNLLATKPLSRILRRRRRSLAEADSGPVQLVALGIGAIIGAGLFSLTGIAASNHAGPAVLWPSCSRRSAAHSPEFATANSRP